MKWILKILLFFVVAVLGMKLMASVVNYREAEIWFKPSPQSQVLHPKGDVSYPLSGGIRVQTPGGHGVTYPNAALITMGSPVRFGDWWDRHGEKRPSLTV